MKEDYKIPSDLSPELKKKLQKILDEKRKKRTKEEDDHGEKASKRRKIEEAVAKDKEKLYKIYKPKKKK